tara:strand:- start:2339 stop:3886 length:1548 start_codon:yes stop_codon:yes gene_type:complete
MKRAYNAAVSYLASVLRNAAASTAPLYENTVRANEQLEKIRDVFNAEWYLSLSRFDEDLEELIRDSRNTEENISALTVALQASWIAALHAALFRSFKMGYGTRGRQDSSTLDKDRIYKEFPAFKDIVDKHSDFASQFAQQYADGYTDRKGAMGFAARINMYGQSLKSAFNSGAVFGGRPGEKIYWRLGSCDHCADCPALHAGSPYNRNTLPTVPGNGDTICKTNCCCYLSFVSGPRTLEPGDSLASWIEEESQAQALARAQARILELEGAQSCGTSCDASGCTHHDHAPDLSKSKRLQEDQQETLSTMQDLMLKRSFLKRLAFFAEDSEGLSAEDKQRVSSLDRQIDDLATDKGLKKKARYNPSAVITRADISAEEVRSIMDMGIDGPSIFRSKIDSALAALSAHAPNGRKLTFKDSKYKESESSDEKVPRVGSSSIVNLVGDGLSETIALMGSILKVANSHEIFVNIAPLDENLGRVLGFGGIWIQGQSDEVDFLLKVLDESDVEYAKAEVVKI